MLATTRDLEDILSTGAWMVTESAVKIERCDGCGDPECNERAEFSRERETLWCEAHRRAGDVPIG